MLRPSDRVPRIHYPRVRTASAGRAAAMLGFVA
jgi:hypothetical protein